MNLKRALTPLAFFPLALACSSQGDSGTNGAIGTGTSTLRVRVTDPTAAASRGQGKGQGASKGSSVQEAIVWVDRVTAHSNRAGWVTLRDGDPLKIDVLKLGQYAVELGFTNLPSGKISQIRLHVSGAFAPYVTTASGQVPLKVPSGEQSGIKVKGLWAIGACEQLAVDLDFNGKKSIWIHPTGHGDLYILRPVIRAGRQAVEPIADCDPNDDDPNDPGPGSDPNDPGAGGDPTDPGAGGDPTDPGAGGDPTDPGAGGDPTDPSGGGYLPPGQPLDDPSDPTAGGDPTGGDPAGGGSTTGTPTDGTPTGGDPTGGTAGGDPTGGDPTGGDPTGGTPTTTSGGPGAPCEWHSQCDVGLFCDNSSHCSNL